MNRHVQHGVMRPLMPLLVLLAAALAPPSLSSEEGAALYSGYCARCHDGTVAKAPPTTMLAIMSASSILRAMESGVMQSYAAGLTERERRALAEHLTGGDLSAEAGPVPAPRCDDPRAHVPSGSGVVAWGVTLGNQRHFGSEETSLSVEDLPSLKLKWAFAYPEAVRARSQPAVAGNTVFVGSQNGSVFALDRESGCLRWTFSTIAEVRTGIVVGEPDSEGKALIFFGDIVGNVYAVNAQDGTLAWRDRPDDHPSLTLTASPALHKGVLYVSLSSLEVTEAADPQYACCTFRGGVAAYRASSGEKLWLGRTIEEPLDVFGTNAVGTELLGPSGAPVWNTPAIDPKRGLLYVGTGENYSSPANGTSDAIIAFSMNTGEMVWHQQMTAGDAWNIGCEVPGRINCPKEDGPDYDFGAATIIARDIDGKDLLLAGQKSGEAYALDLDNDGDVLWRRKLGRGGIQGGVHFGMAADGDVLYVPMSDFDGGPRWPGTPRPGMFALDAATGETLWYVEHDDRCRGRDFCQPGISAAASSLPGGVIAGAMDGILRVYDRDSGDIIWELDTAVEFDAVGGRSARGGSMGGASGPVFSGNMLFLNSGYGIYEHMPGNVLLAFELPE